MEGIKYFRILQPVIVVTYYTELVPEYAEGFWDGSTPIEKWAGDDCLSRGGRGAGEGLEVDLSAADV